MSLPTTLDWQEACQVSHVRKAGHLDLGMGVLTGQGVSAITRSMGETSAVARAPAD